MFAFRADCMDTIVFEKFGVVRVHLIICTNPTWFFSVVKLF